MVAGAVGKQGTKGTPMAKLRHVAMSVPDPAAAAKFYCDAFDMEIVGETDSPLASGSCVNTDCHVESIAAPPE